jgi:hypothetical protein
MIRNHVGGTRRRQEGVFVMLSFAGYEFPQLMTVNLGQITAADPYFDSAGFLSFAQGAYWKIHHATASGDLDSARGLLTDAMFQQLEASRSKATWSSPIQSVAQAAITSVSHDSTSDTVTVRIGATSAAKKKNQLVEDWTFQRPATNQAGATSAPTVTQCPSCGAPVSTDEHGNCRYCHVPIKGVVGDWRLVATTVPSIPKSTSSGCGVSGFVIFIVLVTVVLPLAITGVVLYEVNKTTDQAFNSFNTGFPIQPSSTTARASTTSAPTSTTSAATASPDLNGTLNLSGGLSGTLSPDTLTTPDGVVGSCSARAANVKSIDFTSDGDNDDDGVRQQLVVTAALPDGSQGPGTYQNAKVNVVLNETALPGATNATPEANTWSSGSGSTATVTLSSTDSGSVTFSGLVPTDPKWKDLDGTLSFTCS